MDVYSPLMKRLKGCLQVFQVRSFFYNYYCIFTGLTINSSILVRILQYVYPYGCSFSWLKSLILATRYKATRIMQIVLFAVSLFVGPRLIYTINKLSWLTVMRTVHINLIRNKIHTYISFLVPSVGNIMDLRSSTNGSFTCDSEPSYCRFMGFLYGTKNYLMRRHVTEGQFTFAIRYLEYASAVDNINFRWTQRSIQNCNGQNYNVSYNVLIKCCYSWFLFYPVKWLNKM